MSLLQNQDFAIYRLRTSYLAHIHDGVGERLINIDTSFLNDPAYKAAGWNANPPELKRTYSPPIPTTISSDYFKAPTQFPGRRSLDEADDEDEGGMVTGAGNNEAMGPTNNARRRRRREQLEEDDSSDLSDESDDEYDDTQRPANQIRFAKMPDRSRSGSSPIRRREDGPSLLVTAPSKPPSNPMQRRGSLGAVEAMKERARRNTTTSSDVSSDNDLDPSFFRRRQLQASQGSKSTQSSGALSNQIKEDDEDVPEQPEHTTDPEAERREIEEEASDSNVSSLASGFSEAGDAGSFLGGSPGALSSSGNFGQNSAPVAQVMSPIKSPEQFPPLSDELPELPPIRPISTYVPYSMLSAMLKANDKKPASPFERFANLSGRGEQNPLYVKIYLPPEVQAEKPLELILRRMDPKGGPVIVAEAIGFALWRYADEKLQPPIPAVKFNVNWWTLRIVEDEEVDFDFPPLSRGRPILDFTSNNNRPPRMRARDKPWDEFALVEAMPGQFAENEKITPIYSREAAALEDKTESTVPSLAEPIRSQTDQSTSRAAVSRRNPVTDPMFISTAISKDTIQDKPATAVSHAVQRTGASKTINVHFIDHKFASSTVPIPCTTDTYIAEIHDQACKRLHVDKALYVLKVTNTTTVAPADRTVEALGTERQSLDLVRRRFVGDGTFGLGGSYGSTSPNAPIMLTTQDTPKKPSKPRHPLAGHPADLAGPATLSGLNSNYKRYNVIRKQPLSFAPSHQRVLVLDGEYMHVMPSDTAKERLWDATQGKTTSIHFSSVVGCKVNRKHPKTFRVVVFKERESKRYDFEAFTAAGAAEIVDELRKGIAPYREAIAF